MNETFKLLKEAFYLIKEINKRKLIVYNEICLGDIHRLILLQNDNHFHNEDIINQSTSIRNSFISIFNELKPFFDSCFKELGQNNKTKDSSYSNHQLKPLLIKHVLIHIFQSININFNEHLLNNYINSRYTINLKECSSESNQLKLESINRLELTLEDFLKIINFTNEFNQLNVDNNIEKNEKREYTEKNKFSNIEEIDNKGTEILNVSNLSNKNPLENYKQENIYSQSSVNIHSIAFTEKYYDYKLYNGFDISQFRKEPHSVNFNNKISNEMAIKGSLDSEIKSININKNEAFKSFTSQDLFNTISVPKSITQILHYNNDYNCSYDENQNPYNNKSYIITKNDKLSGDVQKTLNQNSYSIPREHVIPNIKLNDKKSFSKPQCDVNVTRHTKDNTPQNNIQSKSLKSSQKSIKDVDKNTLKFSMDDQQISEYRERNENSINSSLKMNLHECLTFLAKIVELNLFQHNLMQVQKNKIKKVGFENLQREFTNCYSLIKTSTHQESGNTASPFVGFDYTNFKDLCVLLELNITHEDLLGLFLQIDFNNNGLFDENDFNILFSNDNKEGNICNEPQGEKHENNLEDNLDSKTIMNHAKIKSKWYLTKKGIEFNEQVLINILIKISQYEAFLEEAKVRIISVNSFTIEDVFELIKSQNKSLLNNDSFTSDDLCSFLRRINIFTNEKEIKLLIRRIKKPSKQNYFNDSKSSLLKSNENSNKGSQWKIDHQEFITFLEPLEKISKSKFYGKINSKNIEKMSKSQYQFLNKSDFEEGFSIRKVSLLENSESVNELNNFFSILLENENEIDSLKNKLLGSNSLLFKVVFNKILSSQIIKDTKSVKSFAYFINNSLTSEVSNLNKKDKFTQSKEYSSSQFSSNEVIDDLKDKLLVNRICNNVISNISYDDFIEEIYPYWSEKSSNFDSINNLTSTNSSIKIK